MYRKNRLLSRSFHWWARLALGIFVLVSLHYAAQAQAEKKRNVVLAKGLLINVRLSEGIFEIAEHSRPFEARISRSVEANEVVVIPAGSLAFGSVRSGANEAEAVLNLTEVVLDAAVIELVTESLTMELPVSGFQPGTVLVFELARPVEFSAP